jgi:quercetin dioxygenase-like cupin family protein
MQISSWFFACMIAIALLSSCSHGPSRHNPGFQRIERVPLLTAQLATHPVLDRVEIKRIEFGPLQRTGKHRHPIPVVGYIAQGTISFRLEGEPAKLLRAGDPFFEPAGRTVVQFDNASATESAIFIAFYLLGAHDSELIEMLDAGKEPN